MERKFLFAGIALLALALLIGGSGAPEAVVAAPAASACMQQGPAQDGMDNHAFMPYQLYLGSCPAPVVAHVPFQEEWANSGHNNAMAEAFTHWNDSDPPQVPASCAKCHSTPGYLDFLGADGTPPNDGGNPDNPATIGTTVECIACHNDVTWHKTAVTFPSGVTIEDLGDESRCMECHQGRESGPDVDAEIEDAGMVETPDTVSADLGFLNIHYFAAAATMYGSLVHGGYEYEGMTYDQKFQHVEDYDQCFECHDPHTLEVKTDECLACHTDDVLSAADLAFHSDYRMNGSLGDYDGDGNFSEGIYYEVVGLRDMLYTAIRAYAEEVSGVPIIYDVNRHPYWFVDDNGAPGARYNAFTARLLRAAYNYQVAQKDPGQFAHNAKYIIQLLHDSIADLNTMIASPVDLSMADRDDPGHFAGTHEAFRHWDGDGEVPGGCARCHSADGLPLYHKEGVNISTEPSNGFKCTTCHVELGGDWTRLAFDDATFPSGATVSFGEGADPNLCLQCHQGRESGQSVAKAIAGKDDDTVAPSLRFINIHYFAAGATLFGSEVNGLYEYGGKMYKGRFMHVAPFDVCTECHNTHKLEVEFQACNGCHAPINSPEDLVNIRGFNSPADYDGDGSNTEPIADEIGTMVDALYAAMQAYANATAGVDPIVYNPARYPYFFNDAGGSYNTWTPRLLRLAYIYQYVQKDPGGFAHNAKYIIQVLYDALEDAGVDVSGMTRP